MTVTLFCLPDRWHRPQIVVGLGSLLSDCFDRPPCHLGRSQIQVVSQGFEPVISHRYRISIEGIGFNDIRARFKKLAVNLFDDGGLGNA